MKLPAYQDLLSIGLQDLSTALLKKRGNIRFHHPSWGMISHGYYARGAAKETYSTMMVYQNGYVRTIFGDTPAPIKSLKTEELLTAEDWSNKLKLFRDFVIRKWLKDDMGVNSRRTQQEIANRESMGDVTIEILKTIPTAFKHWISDQDKTTQSGFLGAEGIEELLAREIQKDPNKYAILLKDVHKDETIKKTIALLPPELGKQFASDLDLVGDLTSLGL